MDPLKDLLDLFTESRMRYGHLTIIFLYGLIAVFAVGPFLGLIFFPPPQPLDVADLAGNFCDVDITASSVCRCSVQCRLAPLLSSSSARGSTGRSSSPIAKTIGRGPPAPSLRNTWLPRAWRRTPEYTEFLDWLEPQMDRRRGVDWLISNAAVRWVSCSSSFWC
jgi:hypothetical protein